MCALGPQRQFHRDPRAATRGRIQAQLGPYQLGTFVHAQKSVMSSRGQFGDSRRRLKAFAVVLDLHPNGLQVEGQAHVGPPGLSMAAAVAPRGGGPRLGVKLPLRPWAAENGLPAPSRHFQAKMPAELPIRLAVRYPSAAQSAAHTIRAE